MHPPRTMDTRRSRKKRPDSGSLRKRSPQGPGVQQRRTARDIMNVVSRCAEMDISRSRDETAFLLLPVFEEKAPSLAVLEEWSRSRRGGGTSGDVPVSLPSLEITYYLLHSFAMATEGAC